MKIVVIGGTGLVGAALTNKLLASGHDVLPASPSSGVNTITGEGLDVALTGAEVIVDVSNSPQKEDDAVLEFFETSGRNLLAAEHRVGSPHHVLLSVVGADHLQQSGYFRAKLVQEDLVKKSGLPYSIVRSTQFFEFLNFIAASAASVDSIQLPPVLFQPIALSDAVHELTDIILGPPINGTIEIGGPEKENLAELVQRYLSLTKQSSNVIPDMRARYFGVALNDQSLVPGSGARLGTMRFETWCKNLYQS